LNKPFYLSGILKSSLNPSNLNIHSFTSCVLPENLSLTLLILSSVWPIVLSITSMAFLISLSDFSAQDLLFDILKIASI
jgi:hypothetical protein